MPGKDMKLADISPDDVIEVIANDEPETTLSASSLPFTRASV